MTRRPQPACRIDGATPWEEFRHITLPLMKYNLAIGFLLMLIYNIRNFSMVWVMTRGGPGVSSSTLPVMIYRTAFVDFDVGLRNLDLVMGCERRVVFDFINVINGEAKLSQALIKDKRVDNLYILPTSQTRDKDALNTSGVG